MTLDTADRAQDYAIASPTASVVRVKNAIKLSPEVNQALQDGTPVVALESTIVSHGLPRPENLRVARAVEETIRTRGAVPATIAVIRGTVTVGLDDDDLEFIAQDDDVIKVSVRDLGSVVGLRRSGATTVASTSHIAARVGIGVFATGGLGGVHREARDTWDESADLDTLSVEPMVVVCSGVKSILDVPATLERLESLNVGVVGFGTAQFPGFYLTDSGVSLDWRVDTPEEVADIMRARRDLGIRGSLVVANPLPEDRQLDPVLHDRTLEEGLQRARTSGIRGKEVTPFLLDFFHRSTAGASLAANTEIILRNADLAARIAVAGR